MCSHWRCPLCGAVYFEECTCVACLCETLPDATHAPSHALDSDELHGYEIALDGIMRRNRGVSE